MIICCLKLSVLFIIINIEHSIWQLMQCNIILYWNVPCWGHQLWDINCCMCVCLCVCVSVSQCVCLSADISLYCAKNDSTDYPEIVWVCWV